MSRYETERVELREMTWVDTVTTPAVSLADELSSLGTIRAWQRAVLLDIEEPGYTFRNGVLLDPRKRLLTKAPEALSNTPVYRQVVNGATQKRQTIAFLANESPNYYHWMCWGLPLVYLYHEFGILEEVDAFYVGSGPAMGYRRESVARALPGAKLIEGNVGGDRLLFAQLLTSDVLPRTFRDYSRRLFMPNVAGRPTRRLYIARGDVRGRRVLNESHLAEELVARGFESCTMDDLSVQEQADMFASASVIVAPHGAALTNLLFVSPGCTVVEIVTEDYVKPYFYALSAYGDAKYYYYRAEGRPSRLTNGSHIVVNVDDFLERIARIGVLEPT